MLCKKCGAQIPDDAAKCEFCNEIFREEAAPADNPPTEVENTEDLESTKVLDVNDTDIEEASDIEEQPAEDLSQRSTHEIFEENAKRRKQHTEQPVVDEKQQQLEEITSRRNQKKIKQKRHKTILIILICVIVAAAAGAGTFYIRNGGFPNTLIATPAPSSSPIPTLAPVVTPEVSPSPSASADPGRHGRVRRYILSVHHGASVIFGADLPTQPLRRGFTARSSWGYYRGKWRRCQ